MTTGRSGKPQQYLSTTPPPVSFLSEKYLSDKYKSMPTPRNNKSGKGQSNVLEKALDLSSLLGPNDEASVSVEMPSRPLENRLIDDFIFVSARPKETFHQIMEVVEKNQNEIRVFFLKQNPPSKNKYAAYMSELEAVCAGLFKFIAPDHAAASTLAVYDKSNTYVGVVSEEIPNFKSVALDPLVESDLNVDFIKEKKISYATLDSIDKEIREIENEGIKLDKQYKKILEIDMDLNNKIKRSRELKESTEIISTTFQLLTQNTARMLENLNNSKKNADALALLYVNNEKKCGITPAEFQRYRIVKGLAYGLTGSYALMEDDLHQNNMSKNGTRIDNDMMFWVILYEFCDKGLIDSALRQPKESTFIVTKNDIENFPNLTGATPFYWPTNGRRMFSEATTQVLKKFFALSTNAYPHQVNLTYQKLEKNPVFIHYKYACFYDFILTCDEIYKKIILLHLRKDAMFESRLVVDMFMKVLSARVEMIKKTLLTIPEFLTFHKDHGMYYLNYAKEKVVSRNAFFSEKLQTAIVNFPNDTMLHRAYHYQQIDEKKLDKQYAELEKMVAEKVLEVEQNKKEITLSVQSFLSKQLSDTDLSQLEKNEEQYELFKSKVVSALNGYQSRNPFNYFGYGNHSALAKHLLEYCSSLDTIKNKKEALAKLRAKLQEEKTKLEKLPGSMLTLLTDLLAPVIEAPLIKKVSSLS